MLLFSVIVPGLNSTLALDGERLDLTLTNDSDCPRTTGSVTLVAPLEADAVGGSASIQGSYMQRDALVHPFGAAPEPGYLGEYVRRESWSMHLVSREVIALALPGRAPPVLLVGSLCSDRFQLELDLELDLDQRTLHSLSLIFDLEQTELAPGERLALPLLLLAGDDPVTLLEAYADALGRELGARRADHVPTGWCSWYFFYDRVSEQDVLSNLEVMKREHHPAEYVQIDDGFQSCTGDWLTANARFPRGMAPLAAEIRAAGFRPGLWLAPLVLHEQSATLRDLPELALHTHGGELHLVQSWLGRCAVLDCTHPRTEQWLAHVIRTVVDDWGYVYLKLDALAFAVCSAARVRYHRPGTTGPGNLRRGLAIIREAAGDDVFILGCTCHFGPAVGLVDAMRVGPDVKALWEAGPHPSVKHAMRTTLQRSWMHRRLFVNDPDCLLVRDSETELGQAEVRFLATCIALCGGMVVASDDLSRLEEERRRMAHACFPPTGIAARPLSPWEAPVPHAWRAELGQGRALLGLLNWSDESRVVLAASYLRPGELAWDVWSATLVGGGPIELRPHEGALWQVTIPGSSLWVIGDSGHVGFDRLEQSVEAGRLTLTNHRRWPRRVAVELGGKVVEAELPPLGSHVFSFDPK